MSPHRAQVKTPLARTADDMERRTPSAGIKRLFGSCPVPSVVSAHALVFGTCLLLVVVCHWPYLSLPYYWDELGQFIPASVDLLEHGQWLPMSTVPNVHPPGVMI